MCKKIDPGGAITYLGSAGVLLSSSQTEPIPKNVLVERIHLMQASVPIIDVTLADITTLGGFCILILRFIWDICHKRRPKQTWTTDPYCQPSKRQSPKRQASKRQSSKSHKQPSNENPTPKKSPLANNP